VSADPIFRRDSLQFDATVPSLLDRLEHDLPVLFTMSISPAFFAPGAYGIITGDEPLMPKRVHALVAVGFGHRDTDRYVLVRNSWGEDWGLAGHAWVDTAYLGPRLLVAATIGVEV
jgi:hypothetical protein